MRNDYLEAVNEELFARTPSTLLELFVVLQQNPDVKGVRASTIRAVNKNLWLIDEEFRQNPRNHRLFLEILRAPAGVTHELRRMNTYGVLGRYIPAFGRIVGRMQYDLFHAYTVDAHTLFVLSNLRRLSLPKYDHELPQLSAIMQQLPKLEIAYLAALFHDIAKGRGGDHSQLGAVDAEAFCLEQGLSRYDARLVAWLVQNHLELSVTAQKQDISDPEVVNAFARRVGDETHLDYLYVLTSADVRGTNPKLWNSWKASLFQEFYERVKRALRRGLESPIDPDELMRETQDGARKLLAASGRITAPEITRAWERLTAAYFLRHTPEEVAWHTQLLADREPGSEDPLVAVQPSSERGTTAILAFAPHRYNSFAITTAVLDQLGLNIVDARITPTGDGFSLDLYHVLEEDGAPIADSERIGEIERALWRALQHPDEAPVTVTRRVPRQARMFRTATQIAVTVDERNRRSVLELVAGDRPGLLCDVGKVLMEERVDLLAAKIMTVGERAEDVFYLASLVGRAARRSRGHAPAAAACPARSIAAPPRERPPRTTRRLPVRTTGAAEGRHHAARRAAAHRDVHRRAQARAAAVRDRRAAPRTRQARQLSGDRRAAGNCAPPAPRWLERRFAGRACRPDTMVLPVNGTREALFSFVQAVVSTRGAQSKPVVAMPNPFYQIYEGAALLAGAEPVFLNTTAGNRFQPDLDAVPAEIWKRCEVLFLCSPGNPTGAVLSLEFLRHALELAEKYDFVIASDECYAELYRDEARRRRRCCRRRWPTATIHSSAAWCFIRCPSARACPGCAPASSPAIPR